MLKDLPILLHNIKLCLNTFVRDANLPGVLPGGGGVCGLGGEEDGLEGKVGPGQAQGGGTQRSFSPDPEN